jgi:hypothetical protein
MHLPLSMTSHYSSWNLPEHQYYRNSRNAQIFISYPNYDQELYFRI